MQIPVSQGPSVILNQYNLQELIYNNFFYVENFYIEILKGMYGLCQPGIITNQQIVAHLNSHGYIQSPRRHGPFVFETRPIMFALMVDDVVVKYAEKDHTDIVALKDKTSQRAQLLGTEEAELAEGLGDLKDVLHMNQIKNCPVTVNDTSNATKIWGPPSLHAKPLISRSIWLFHSGPMYRLTMRTTHPTPMPHEHSIASTFVQSWTTDKVVTNYFTLEQEKSLPVPE
jgi:hypothetical protein